jgi:large subunit ribosomal protein L13
MRTYVTKPGDIERKWFLVDVKGQTLGRLAVVVADLLRGKSKTNFSPSVDCGDFVVVINTKDIVVTGNKLEAKMYHRHSGYPGGLTSLTLAEVLEKDANKVIYEAVKGMLPKNRLADDMIKKLKLFTGSEHAHTAQKPEEIKVQG